MTEPLAKYGVDTTPVEVPPNTHCPRCNTVVRLLNPPLCPACGTAPYEVTKEAQS